MNVSDRKTLINQIEMLVRELEGDGITHAANFRIASSIVKKPSELKKNLRDPDLKNIYLHLEDAISASAKRYNQIAKLLNEACLFLALIRTENPSGDGIFGERETRNLRDVNKRRNGHSERWTPTETFDCRP